MWVLGVNTQSSARVSTSLNHWTISPVPKMVLVLNVWRGHGEKLRLVIICQVWSPWREATGEGVASVEVESPDVQSLSKTAADVRRRLAWTYDMSYLFCRSRDREVELAMKTPWSLENYKWIPDITLYTVKAWLWYDLAVIVPCFFPCGAGSI